MNERKPFRDIAYPIEHIDFDLAKVKAEVNWILYKHYQNRSGSFCVTNRNCVEDKNWFHYNAAGVTDWTDSEGNTLDPKTFYQEGWVWQPTTGWHDNRMHRDQDLIDWNPQWHLPELKRLTGLLEQRYNQRMRCRMSIMKGYYSLGSHCDPHTPWRVHLTLEKGPLTHWVFDNQYVWEQPQHELWMVRTGNIAHQVRVGPGETRIQVLWHLWESDLGPELYQYPK